MPQTPQHKNDLLKLKNVISFGSLRSMPLTRGMPLQPSIWIRRQLLACGCAPDDFEEYFSRCLWTVLATDRKFCNKASLI